MAHALFGYDGPCKNIHGHHYRLHVTISGKPRHTAEHPKDGMVMDFSDMKKIVQEEVLDHFDHALMLNGESEHRKMEGMRHTFPNLVFVPFQPTCENILSEIKNRLLNEFGPGNKLCYLRLDETPDCYAEWLANEN